MPLITGWWIGSSGCGRRVNVVIVGIIASELFLGIRDGGNHHRTSTLIFNQLSMFDWKQKYDGGHHDKHQHRDEDQDDEDDGGETGCIEGGKQTFHRLINHIFFLAGKSLTLLIQTNDMPIRAILVDHHTIVVAIVGLESNRLTIKIVTSRLACMVDLISKVAFSATLSSINLDSLISTFDPPSLCEVKICKHFGLLWGD